MPTILPRKPELDPPSRLDRGHGQDLGHGHTEPEITPSFGFVSSCDLLVYKVAGCGIVWNGMVLFACWPRLLTRSEGQLDTATTVLRRYIF